MLSILIPTYNYNIYNLVCELKNQCSQLGIAYEIIAQDDASHSEINIENQKINALENCSFYSNNVNIGRGKNRNSLANKSKFEWLLFLDCDTTPTSKNFIENYIKATNVTEVAFGGLQYQAEKPKKNQLLRWVYGKNREALSLNERLKNRAQTALTSNLLIKKDIFKSHSFDEEIVAYGYEDYLFFLNLKQKNIPITHLENPVIHLGLETSKEFLDKTKIATENLVFIAQKQPLWINENKIIKAYRKLNACGLDGLFRFIFNQFRSKIERQLVSENPSLILFDWYKLGCFCNAQNQKK